MEVFNLNIIPGSVAPIIHASQYDDGREFRANLFEGPSVYTLTGAETITINVRKPDGNVVTAAVTNTADSYVEFATTEQMTACSGANLCELKFENSPVKIGSLNFILSVEADPLEGGIQSESAIHDLQAQIASAVADQYDSANVVFDANPTAGHGVGFAVTSEGVKNAIDNAVSGLSIPDELNDLSDVNISGQALGEALVWDGTKWVNGTVSTVGNLDDLNDVDTTGKASGDSLRYDGNDWVAKPTTIEMTQAEYNAIVDFTPYANTHIIITDAPNLNPTASDIEYSSGVTVADKLTSLDTNKADKTLTSGTVTASSNVTVARYTLKQFGNIKFLSLALYVTVAHSSGAKLASLSITPTQMLDMVAVAKPSQNACAWNVDTDGYLYTNDAMQTGQTYYLNAWYI